MSDLLSNYQHRITTVEIITGGSGVFDVEVDGEMLYSKHGTGRHAEPGEVLGLFEQRYAPDLGRYGT